MTEQPSSIGRMKPTIGPLTSTTKLVGSQDGFTRAINIDDIKTYVGTSGGGGGDSQGFIFEELAPAVNNDGSIDFTKVVDNVIYHSSVSLDILDKKIEGGDYVQFHAGKTKVISFPQLSRLYHFDTTSPENFTTSETELSSQSDGLTIVTSSATTGVVSYPDRTIVNNSYLNITPASLDNFIFTQTATTYPFTLKSNNDPSGLLHEVAVEYDVPKGYFYTLLLALGTAQKVKQYFYAGVDRDKNYLLYSQTSTNVGTWYIADASGVETVIAVIDPTTQPKILVRDGLELHNNLASLDPLGFLTDSDANYTSLLSFSDTSANIAVKVVFSIDDPTPSGFSLPIRNSACALNQSVVTNSLRPVELKFSVGVARLEVQKQRSMVFLLVSTDSVATVYSNLFTNGLANKTGLLIITYDPATDTYSHALQTPAGGSSGPLTGLATSDFYIEFTKSQTGLNIDIAGLSSGNIADALPVDNLYLIDATALLGGGVYGALTLTYDISGVGGTSTLNTGSIANRDRVIIDGAATTILGKMLYPGDSFEFFKDKTEILVTRKEVAPATPIELVVTAGNGDTAPGMKCWYDPAKKRIGFSGNFYYSGTGGILFNIAFPSDLLSKNWQANRLFGYFTDGTFAADQQFMKASQIGIFAVEAMSIVFDNVTSDYAYGTIAIPETVIAIEGA